MGKDRVLKLAEVSAKRQREGTDGIVAELRYLLEKAQAGKLKGFCYAALTVDQTEKGYVKARGCSMQELIGGSVLLTGYLVRESH